MNRTMICLLVLALVIPGMFIVGCQKKVPEPEPLPPTPVPTVTPTPAPTPVPTMSPEEIRMMKIKEAEEELSEIDVYFDFDQATLSDMAKDKLAQKAEYLVQNPDISVVIEGHCDERGSNEYNLGLGERRAAAAKKYLVTYGVSDESIETVTYGEEKPVCFESNEDCWSRNRRAHFVVMK